MRTEILDMLKSGKVEQALAAMAADNNNAKLVLADYRNEKIMLESGLIDESDFLHYQEKIISRVATLPDEPVDVIKAGFTEKGSAFLSYTHEDLQTAVSISEELAKYGIRVSIDQTNVEAGQPIRDFIANQTRQNNAVLVLLSRNSLKSPWVIYESTMAMFNALLNNKRIIPLAIDRSFEDDEFSLEIIEVFDMEIERKKNAARQHELKGINPEFIQHDITRLVDARNQLPKVLAKLREVAFYSVASTDFMTSLHKVASILVN